MPIDDVDHTSATASMGGPPPAALELTPGLQVGRYILARQLGRGGMGQVFVAYDPELDRNIALKVMRVAGDNPGEREVARMRLQREAMAMAQLSHPNVVAIHDVGHFDDSVFIAMELVEGPTLKQLIKDGSLTPREIVRIFVAAGRGLIAAHDAGLIHRDFKPANVLVGDDGRVRVLDFGLARPRDLPYLGKEEDSADEDLLAADTEDDDTGHEPALPFGADSSDSVSGTNSADSPLQLALTLAGTVVGTPAYMAPEQHLGHKVDERTDQFGFCVALYEALYGKRPFDDSSKDVLVRAVVHGRFRKPPEDARVPARLRRVAVRGLSVRPDDRYPSMAALLADLGRDPARTYRRAALAVGIAGLAAVAVFGLVRKAGDDPCSGARADLAGVWDDAVKQRARQQFHASRRVYADSAYAQLELILDRHADDWVAMKTATCRATYVKREQSAQLLDLRTDCLNRRRDKLAALTRLVTEPENPVQLYGAVQAAANLTAVGVCNDDDALTERVPPPDEPRMREAVTALEHRLDRAEALRETGNYREGLDVAAAVVVEAGTLDYAPLLAEARYVLGTLHRDAGDAASAETALRAALEAGARARDDRLIARAWIELVGVIGYDQARPDDGMALMPAAETAITRAGDDPLLAANLYHHAGKVLWYQGKQAESIEYRQRALKIRERELGDDHLSVADSINILGMAATSEGRYDDARRFHQRAHDIREAQLGRSHPKVADSLNNLGVVAYHAGDYDEAFQLYQRALAIREASLGPSHPHVATTYNNLGALMQDQGQLAHAREYYEKAVAIWVEASGEDHPDVAIAQSNLGDLALLQKDWEAALRFCSQSLATEQASLGADHVNLAYSLTCIGEAHLGAGDPEHARDALERAIALREQSDVDPTELARTRFALARALGLRGPARKRAMTLATAARDAYAAAGSHHSEDAARVAAWLNGSK